MNGDAFSIKAPKCSKKCAATLKGNSLPEEMFLEYFLFFEDFGAPQWIRCRHSSYAEIWAQRYTCNSPKFWPKSGICICDILLCSLKSLNVGLN